MSYLLQHVKVCPSLSWPCASDEGSGGILHHVPVCVAPLRSGMLRTVSDMEIVPQRFRMGDEQSPGSLCVGIKVSGRVGLFDTAADSRLMLSWKAAMGNSVSDIRLLVSRCHGATNKC